MLPLSRLVIGVVRTSSAAFGVPPRQWLREGGRESSNRPCSGQTEEVTLHSRWRTRAREFLQGARLPRQSVRQRAASSGAPPPSLPVLPPLCLSVLCPQIPSDSPHRGANPLRCPRSSVIRLLIISVSVTFPFFIFYFLIRHAPLTPHYSGSLLCFLGKSK